MQLDSVMSMMRYCPAKGTAGFARSRVRGKSRSPAPPASKTPSVSLIVQIPQAIHSRQTQISRAGTHESSMQCTENVEPQPKGGWKSAGHDRSLRRRTGVVLFSGDAQRLEKREVVARKGPVRWLVAVVLGGRFVLDLIEADRRLEHQEHIKPLLPDLADNARNLLALRHGLVNRFAELLNEVLDLLIQRHLPVICWNAPEPRIGYSQNSGNGNCEVILITDYAEARTPPR